MKKLRDYWVNIGVINGKLLRQTWGLCEMVVHA